MKQVVDLMAACVCVWPSDGPAALVFGSDVPVFTIVIIIVIHSLVAVVHWATICVHFQFFIELCRIRKCFTQKGGVFVLEEYGKPLHCSFVTLRSLSYSHCRLFLSSALSFLFVWFSK